MKLTLATIGLMILAVGCDSEAADHGKDAPRAQTCRMPFTEYSAGPSVAGLELEARVPNCGKRPFVGYVYGTCRVTQDTGCAPPLEIQSWSIRHRRPSRAPAGNDVELRRGRVTIVIFARSDRLAASAVRSLQRADRSDIP
jgi:hypothetical protein